MLKMCLHLVCQPPGGAQQGSWHSLFRHSCPVLSQTLTLPEPRGEKTPSPPADSLLSGPRGCPPEQPTLIFSCQIWDVGCRLEAHRLFSLLWFGASGQSTYQVIRSSFLEVCLVILVPANSKAFFFLPCAFISLHTSQGGCSIHNVITILNCYVLSYNNTSLPTLLIPCSQPTIDLTSFKAPEQVIRRESTKQIFSFKGILNF